MPYSAYVNNCGEDGCEDHIVKMCSHEHRTLAESRRCSQKMLEAWQRSEKKQTGDRG